MVSHEEDRILEGEKIVKQFGIIYKEEISQIKSIIFLPLAFAPWYASFYMCLLNYKGENI